jgi:hypothetical protein
MEKLSKVRIKRQHSTHVFVCPRLMTPLWQKQLYKATDIVIVVPPGHPAWSLAMFEALIIGIEFPFVQHAPRQLGSTPKMHAVARELQKVWEDPGVDGGDILRKLCVLCWILGALPADVVWSLLHFGPRVSFSHPRIGTQGGSRGCWGQRPDVKPLERRVDQMQPSVLGKRR